jgi:hypothetical protein
MFVLVEKIVSIKMIFNMSYIVQETDHCEICGHGIRLKFLTLKSVKKIITNYLLIASTRTTQRTTIPRSTARTTLIAMSTPFT